MDKRIVVVGRDDKINIFKMLGLDTRVLDKDKETDLSEYGIIMVSPDIMEEVKNIYPDKLIIPVPIDKDDSIFIDELRKVVIKTIGEEVLKNG